MTTIPKKRGIHLGIIPDGSRRWAKGKNDSNYDGKQSGEKVDQLLKHVFTNYPQVTDVSIWALSTENLKRQLKDRKLVFNLISKKMVDLMFSPEIFDQQVKVNIIGSRLSELPDDIRNIMNEIVSKTKDHKKKTLNICIGYGGREEILNAVMESSKWLRKNPLIAKVHENVFEKFLLIPKPLDVVIRTGGEKRLSGFMLFQIEYAELFFTDTLWPDFGHQEFDKIMKEFQTRNRRYGK